MYLYIIKRTLRVDNADMIHPVTQWRRQVGAGEAGIGSCFQTI